MTLLGSALRFHDRMTFEVAASRRRLVEVPLGEVAIRKWLACNGRTTCIAQQSASEHPETLRRLVLISTACCLGPVGRDMQADVAAELRAGHVRRAGAIALAGLVPRAGVLAHAVAWIAGPRIFCDEVAAADLITTIEGEDGFDLAACQLAIRAPTLIIVGGRDRYYNVALFEETAALIPNSQLKIYPNKGHIAVATDRNARADVDGFLSWQPAT